MRTSPRAISPSFLRTAARSLHKKASGPRHEAERRIASLRSWTAVAPPRWPVRLETLLRVYGRAMKRNPERSAPRGSSSPPAKLAVALAIALLAFVVGGCGGDSSSADETSTAGRYVAAKDLKRYEGARPAHHPPMVGAVQFANADVARALYAPAAAPDVVQLQRELSAASSQFVGVPAFNSADRREGRATLSSSSAGPAPTPRHARSASTWSRSLASGGWRMTCCSNSRSPASPSCCGNGTAEQPGGQRDRQQRQRHLSGQRLARAHRLDLRHRPAQAEQGQVAAPPDPVQIWLGR